MIQRRTRPGDSFLKFPGLRPGAAAASACAFVAGMLAHGMALLNKLSWHDDIASLFDVGSTVPSGRWMLEVLGNLEEAFYQDGHYSLPLFNGLLGLLCIAAAACLLADLFRLRPAGGAALGCLMAVFPSVTSLFAYVFTMHFYLLAMLCTVLAAYLLCRFPRWGGWVAAVLLAGCALGVYQAYFPMLPTLLLLYDMHLLADPDVPFAGFWKRLAVQAACLICTLVFYLAVNRVFLAACRVEMTDYMGLNQVEAFQPVKYLSRLVDAYHEFFLPSRGEIWQMYPGRMYTCYQLMLLGDLVMGLLLFLRLWKQHRGRALMLALLMGLFPLGYNLIFVMSEEMHGLMTYTQVLQVLLFLWLLERTELRPLPLRRVGAWAAALLLGISGLGWTRYANACYLKAALQQQEAISWFTTLVTRIKSSAGYDPARPVLFVNAQWVFDDTFPTLPQLEAIRLMPYQYSAADFPNDYAWDAFMERWCGFRPIYYEGTDLSQLPEVQALPHYPDAGSIQVIQDVLVVRF